MTYPIRPGIRSILALLAGALTVPAFAAPAQGLIPPRQAVVAQAAAGTASSYPGSPQANPNRAYPPSCAAYPLPAQPSGPLYTASVALPQNYSGYGVEGAETVTVTIWRVACSSSGNATPYNPNGTGYNAMTLMRIARSSANEGQGSYYPLFPQGIAVSAASDSACNNSNINVSCFYARTATEPNTYLEDSAGSGGIVNSTTYVLENYQGYPNFPYNGAFKLWLDSGLENYGYSAGLMTISVPAYSPTQSTYPDAFNPLPIDGYAATSWYDSAHGGEGMLINVSDNGDNATRAFFAAWYTYDPLGMPFWIVAGGTLPIGATSVDATGYYYANGGFAGASGSTATQQQWGTLSFKLLDCNHIQFTYDGKTDTATNGPSGSGTRNWIRLVNINGMSCE